MRIAIPLLVCGLAAAAADDPADLLAEVQRRLADEDRFSAFEYVQAQGEPARVLAVYSGLTRHFVRKERDLDRFVAFSRAGIHYGLTLAALDGDPAGAAALRSAAKTLAYDLAAETWPGWGGDGPVPTASQTALGHEAARLNLRLARALDKGDLRVAYAHWMLAAHELAAGRYDRARTGFGSAERHARAAGDESAALSARGFRAIARIAAGAGEEGRMALTAVRDALAGRAAAGDGDAAFFAGQFDPALAAFVEGD